MCKKLYYYLKTFGRSLLLRMQLQIKHLFLDLACIFKFVQIADNGLNKKRNKKTVIPLLLFFCFKFVPL